MQDLFEIKNLDMHYPLNDGFMGKNSGYVYALNDVNFKIYDGEILGLVGESGCGKSTLGKCVLRLIAPTHGEVLYKKDDVLKKNKKELKIFREHAQLIFQNPYASLDPKMTIYETLKEPLVIHGYKDKNLIDEKIKNIAELVGIEERSLFNYPHEFSGGQRQRIAIARAIILSPKFIVADEPVSALDVSIQAQIINLLLDLKKKLNLTVLFVSHDLSVVKYVSDRVAVMYLGEIVELGLKNEIFNNPKHPYTKALLSAIPTINQDLKTEKILLEGDLPSPQNPPKGCKFHTRCPYAKEICREIEPQKQEISYTHFAKCHFVNS
ncbi:MAG: ATP-binding cassette domain-containing protein [Candidatus Gastranaerophilales bacterium]|nr:ATP-binding cassette domain-containing protein [Candidatus Gastranaerophilales bacterium]